jgi:hypothetical protein
MLGDVMQVGIFQLPHHRVYAKMKIRCRAPEVAALGSRPYAPVLMIDTFIVRVHQHGAALRGAEDSRWAGHEAG